jgi:hypothetical protein
MSEGEDDNDFTNPKITKNLPPLRLSTKVEEQLTNLQKNSFSWESRQVDALIQVLNRMQADAASE